MEFKYVTFRDWDATPGSPRPSPELRVYHELTPRDPVMDTLIEFWREGHFAYPFVIAELRGWIALKEQIGIHNRVQWDIQAILSGHGIPENAYHFHIMPSVGPNLQIRFRDIAVARQIINLKRELEQVDGVDWIKFHLSLRYQLEPVEHYNAQSIERSKEQIKRLGGDPDKLISDR